MDYFSYNDGKDDLPKDVFKISPSRLSRFFDDTSNWYRESLLGEAPVFQGNTSSFLGTAVHGLAQMFVENGFVDYRLVENFIDSIRVPDIDKDFIRRQYPVMYTTLQESYLKQVTQVKGIKPELFLHYPVLPGVVVGGSIDLLTPEEIVDYKTTGDLNAPTSVKRAYYFQQLCYVWMARQLGMPIKRFRLVYITTHEVGRISPTTGKPLKDYPSTVTSVIHEVTNDDITLIENVLKLVAESVIEWQKNPSIRHLLAQDMRLKQHTNKSIFKV